MEKLEFNNENATVGMNESNPIGTLTLVDTPFNITFNWKEKTGFQNETKNIDSN